MEMTNQKILITGGSAGIGLALARLLLGRGNQVAVCGRNPEALLQVSREYPGIVPLRCDLSAPQDIADLVGEVERQLGGLSVLVNNAGVQLNYSFLDESPETTIQNIEAEVGANFLGLAIATARFLPLLKKEPAAALVNISSGLALVPKRSAPVYCATKAAVHLFSMALRWQMEAAGSSIRVFEVLPPLVDTAMTAGRGTGKLSPDQVAAAIVRGLEKDQQEMRIGKVRTLARLNRLFPSLAERIMRDA